MSAAGRIDWAEARRQVERGMAALAGDELHDAAAQARLLRERAAALAAPLQADSAQPDGDGTEVLAFELAGERYAFDSAWVARVVPLPPLTALPGLPPFMVGITAIEGEVLAVLDLRALLALPLAGLAEPTVLVLLRGEGREVGVLAEAIAGVRRFPRATPGQCPPSLARLERSYLVGVAPDRTALLDARRLLTDSTLVVHADRT